MQAPLQINQGDKLTVEVGAQIFTGKVLSVDWYPEAGWYIEMEGGNMPLGYVYWKQRDDGGRIVSVNGVAV